MFSLFQMTMKNLFSINAVTHNGDDVKFEEINVIVYIDYCEILLGKLHSDGLFKVYIHKNAIDNALLYESATINWRRKMAHIGLRNLERLPEMVDGVRLNKNDLYYE